MPRKTFANGFPLPASDLNTYLMDQSVQTYADATARTAALATPVEGQMSYLADTNTAYVYDGTSWNAVVDAKNYGSVLSNNGNAIINGAFDFWQRKTSDSPGTFGTKPQAPDRWTLFLTATGRTISRQSSGLTGFQYAARIQRDSGNTDGSTIWLYHQIETKESLQFAGKTVTLSYYAKAGANFSASSNLLTPQIIWGTGTDENSIVGYTGSTTIAATDSTLTTSWQRFTKTFAIPDTATEMTVRLHYTPTGTAGAADYFEVTGVQLEAGSVATPFSRAGGTLQGELAACQRYLAKFGGSDNYEILGTGWSTTTNYAEIFVPYKVTTRVSPSAIEYSNLTLFDGVSTLVPVASLTVAGGGNGINGIRLVAYVTGGLTQYRSYELLTNNTTSGYLRLPAEL